jgi:hypothetical protein
MDESVLALLGFVAVFVVLAVAALRFGVDFSGLTRELPQQGDHVVRMSPAIGRYQRGLMTLDAFREHARTRDAWRATAGGWVPLRYPSDLRNGLA